MVTAMTTTNILKCRQEAKATMNAVNSIGCKKHIHTST